MTNTVHIHICSCQLIATMLFGLLDWFFARSFHTWYYQYACIKILSNKHCEQAQLLNTIQNSKKVEYSTIMFTYSKSTVSLVWCRKKMIALVVTTKTLAIKIVIDTYWPFMNHISSQMMHAHFNKDNLKVVYASTKIETKSMLFYFSWLI